MGAFISNANRLASSHVTLTQNISENSEAVLFESLSQLDEQGFNILHEFAVASYIFETDGVEAIVREGFGDFMSNAVKFFKDLLKRIADFFKEIFAYLSSFVMSFDKFIEKNKDRLMKSGKVQVKGYKYTLDQQVPNLEVIDRMVGEFNGDLQKIDEMKMEDLRQKIQQYTGQNMADVLRGTIVGSSSPVEREDVQGHLHRLFRGGNDEPDVIDVDNGDINGFISNYKEFKNDFKKIKKDQMNIERSINSLKAFFERGYRSQYVGQDKKLVAHTVTKGEKRYDRGEQVEIADKAETIRVINLYYSFRFGQMRELCNVVIQTAAAKTNAYKEYLRFQEKVLRKAVFGGESNED